MSIEQEIEDSKSRHPSRLDKDLCHCNFVGTHKGYAYPHRPTAWCPEPPVPEDRP